MVWQHGFQLDGSLSSARYFRAWPYCSWRERSKDGPSWLGRDFPQDVFPRVDFRLRDFQPAPTSGLLSVSSSGHDRALQRRGRLLRRVR